MHPNGIKIHLDCIINNIINKTIFIKINKNKSVITGHQERNQFSY